MGGKIAAVIDGSIAEEIGIEPGDILLAINDNEICDLIDYNYYEDEEYLELTVAKPDGETWLCEVEKYPEESLGLVFEAAVFDGIRPCANHCLFCFVDQLQPQPRTSLLVKDDDYRLSFLEGNFITCTNLLEDDYQRIGELRLSPLYVSVHTVDPLLRQRLLGCKKPAEILLTLQRLIAMGCRIHTQIVLCPGINDGDKLKESLDSLVSLALPRGGNRELSPAGGLLSIAVVPVGLTRFQHHPELRPLSAAEAAAILDEIESRQQKYLDLLGSRLVFAADEFYLKAGRPFPAAATYEDYPQLENGVGLAAQFLERWQKVRGSVPQRPLPRTIAIVSGVNGATVLRPLVDEIRQISGSDLTLITVPNSFYGAQVTVSGLLTGSCIIDAVASGRYQQLILPSTMLKHGEDIFLDDMTTGELAATLKTTVTVCEPEPAALLQALFSC
jgi:putative radical SAM enzyme (TIGR03279 family)